MRRLVLFALPLLFVTVSTAVSAQAPKPGPEVKKLEAFAGTWRYEGDAKAGPLGPAAKFSGTQTGTMIMNGFGLEIQGQEDKGQFGAVQWREIDVYDAASKSYPALGVQNDGMTWSASGAVSGNTWKYPGALIVKGTSYKYRGEGTFSADGKTYTSKGEISADGGKTWVPWNQTTMTKTK
jgi:hypothetical protein